MNLCCSASTALILISIPFVHGWVTRNFHVTISNDNRVHNSKGVCPSSLFSPTITTKQPNRRLFAATVEDEEEEIIEYLDDDDEDDDAGYDYKKAAEQQAEWMRELAILSKTTSRDPTAVATAQEVFDEMFQAYVETDDSTFFPTVDVYNLLLETHAHSPFPTGGEEAEKILRRMEDTSNDFVARPNEKSYLYVMDAWAMRRQPSKAMEVLEQQKQREGSPPVTTNAYNKLIKSYGMVEEFDEAESVFRSLQTEGRANHKSWVQLMKARLAAGPSGDDDEDDTEDTIRSYFQQMEDDGVQPETDAYNLLIRCVGSTSPQKAEAMLFELLERFRGENDATVKPNAGTFRSVLLAHRNKGRGKVGKQMAAKAEQLLQIFDGLSSTTTTTTTSAAPTADETKLVETALGMISRSRDSRKAVRADRILRKRMASAAGATPRMVRSVLEACASTNAGNAEEKLAAFQIALTIFKEMRASGPSSDGATTGLFLRACHRLLPAGRKRDEVAGTVFRECSELGLVDDFVLSELEQAASEDLQLELLGGFGVDGVAIPERWSRN
eukprot:CAMPEP_0197178376 /NCGR_PEP_ID=MMETSP1423-20130617/3671_1 /TAXON_ID=476441 /ORGANISM="Pseudo-nitzschia heimii, Strain UNC1101" /LENGTH=554 /DNA_ID=CAMNT_0042628101 /DNA_START=85 /DNA_END=1746 /DNA_ORIENTATION=-